MLLVPLIASAVEVSLNRLCFHDRITQSISHQLAGKALKLAVRELPATLILVFGVNHVTVVSQREQAADCTLQTHLSALFSLHDRQQLAALLKTGDVVVEGDIQVIQQFVSLIDMAQWDPADWLSPYIGDVGAEALSQGFSAGVQKMGDWLNRQSDNLAQAFTEEWRLAPGKCEVACFSDEVERLSQRLEAVMKRIELLEKAQ